MLVTDGSGTKTHVYGYDNGNMTYDGVNSYGYDAQNRLVTVTKEAGAPLAVACDNEDLVFTTGGDASWFAQTARKARGRPSF
jgi:hypothetical protein